MIRAIFALLLVFTAPAFAAEPLKTDEVDRFVAAMTDINDLDRRYPEVDAKLGFNEAAMSNPMGMRDAFAKIITPDGKVVVMDSLIEAVNANPQALGELRTAMNKNGFRDPKDFASVGNRLLMASARLEMSDDDLQQMQMMSSMPVEMLPAPMREVVPLLEAFGRAVAAVPASDVEQARRVQPLLDALEDER